MRIIIAGLLGGLAMYAWATLAHLSPLARIGVHTMPNDKIVVAALKLNLGDKGGVYVYPTPPAGAAPSAGGAQTGVTGMMSYAPNGPTRGHPAPTGRRVRPGDG